MNTNEILELLVNEGCPPIAYRVRKEIKQDCMSEHEYLNYQKLIYDEPKVQTILSWQESDGYFGTRLHTAQSKSKVWTHEGCVRYLLEMGLENENVKRALDVMLHPGWGKECENSRAANVFKYEMIRASLFAQAGFENHEVVSEWVDDALQGFRNIAEVENYADLVGELTDRKLVFKEKKYIPTIYHLRILAYTRFWRTEENQKMLECAYEKLYQWLPLPPMYHKSKSYPVASLGNVCWSVNQNFNEDLGFVWLHFYEMSARMGMLGKKSPFRKHFEKFKGDVFCQSESIIKYAKKDKGIYLGWSGYSGMALEGNWKTTQQIIRDFMFRLLLIDKYSNQDRGDLKW